MSDEAENAAGDLVRMIEALENVTVKLEQEAKERESLAAKELAERVNKQLQAIMRIGAERR